MTLYCYLFDKCSFYLTLVYALPPIARAKQWSLSKSLLTLPTIFASQLPSCPVGFQNLDGILSQFIYSIPMPERCMFKILQKDEALKSFKVLSQYTQIFSAWLPMQSF